jgi:hypothetical protein
MSADRRGRRWIVLVQLSLAPRWHQTREYCGCLPCAHQPLAIPATTTDLELRRFPDPRRRTLSSPRDFNFCAPLPTTASERVPKRRAFVVAVEP